MHAEITVNAGDLLAIIERHAREVAQYCATPPGHFNPQELSRHIARMYSFAEKLQEMAADSKASASNGAEAAN